VTLQYEQYAVTDGKTAYNAGETSCSYKKFLVRNMKRNNLFYFVTTHSKIFTGQRPFYIRGRICTHVKLDTIRNFSS
jgi:hypothetical protein